MAIKTSISFEGTTCNLGNKDRVAAAAAMARPHHTGISGRVPSHHSPPLPINLVDNTTVQDVDFAAANVGNGVEFGIEHGADERADTRDP